MLNFFFQVVDFSFPTIAFAKFRGIILIAAYGGSVVLTNGIL